MKKKLSRRRVLRGIVSGSAVTIGLPLLNCFLNDNGTAWASGEKMPVRFGTWAWGLGMNKAIFVPKKTGTGFDLPEEIASLANVRDHVNLLTNATYFRDSYQNLCHFTGWVVSRTGAAPKATGFIPGETIDVTIANQIGNATRFKSLTATAAGDVRGTYSYENTNTPNAQEWSPIQFYTHLFGPDFQDPNAPEFKPDPRVLIRKSALSGVMDQSKELMSTVGAEDRQRLDQYFTGLRHLELQFQQRLEKPEPIAACVRPKAPAADVPMGLEAESVQLRHRMMTDLLVMALACDQTRVFNMAFSPAQSNTIKPGYEKPHHTTTHEEPNDAKLGYQPTASWFTRRSMESWAYFVEAFTKVKEGDGTLLDNVFIYATTDHGYARMHSLDGVPLFTAGRAGGKVKSGMHIDMNGSAATRLGLTALQLFGINKQSWGVDGNNTSQAVSEILA